MFFVSRVRTPSIAFPSSNPGPNTSTIRTSASKYIYPTLLPLAHSHRPSISLLIFPLLLPFFNYTNSKNIYTTLLASYL